MMFWDPVRGLGRVAALVTCAALIALTLTGDHATPRPGLLRLPAQPSLAPAVAQSVPFSSRHALDIYRPPGTQAALPVVVMAHGCCGDRADLSLVSAAVAGAGALVFNPDWGGLRPGSTFPQAYAEVACAVRFAHAEARRYGGDRANVTLLGWSDGAMVGAVVAAAGRRFAPVGCLAPREGPIPDAFVGIAGFYGWRLPVDPVYVNDRAVAFFGGTPASAPQAWRDATPYAWLGSRTPRCVTLVVGAADPLLAQARRYALAMRGAGHRVRFVVAEPAGDQSLLSSRTEEGRTTVHEAVAAGRSCAAPP
jgi:acetyl esterase/lipase